MVPTPQREWIQPIRHGFLLLRAHLVTFFRLDCHGKGWRSYTKAAFLSSLRHNLHSKVRLRNDQTPRNVYIHVDVTIMRCFQAELFSRFLPSSYAGHVNLAREKP